MWITAESVFTLGKSYVLPLVLLFSKVLHSTMFMVVLPLGPAGAGRALEEK